MRLSTLFLSSSLATALAWPSVWPYEKRATALPSNWKPGVKWQIVIHAPIDIRTTVIPTEAQVWDIDYFHALDHPEIIPALVCFHPGSLGKARLLCVTATAC
jgi:hypothetical protein